MIKSYIRFQKKKFAAAQSLSYYPTQVAELYKFPKRTGKGCKIGFIELGGGYEKSDLDTFFKTINLPVPTVKDRLIDGATNAPDGINGAQGEVTLDIEVGLAVAPQAEGIVYFAPNSNDGFLNAIKAAIADKVDAISISWGCYDKNTEVLTQDGWRYFADIRGDELIATLNPETKTLEYQNISQVHKYRYEGQLHSYKSRGTDLVVTPNHNMYVKKYVNNKPKTELLKSEDIFDNNWYYVPKTAKWNGQEVEKIEVAGHSINADLWLEFLGYFLSEGWAGAGNTYHKERTFSKESSRLKKRRRNANGSFAVSILTDERESTQSTYTTKAFDETTYTTGISQIKNENINVIQTCLNKLPFKFIRHGHAWQCRTNKELCKELGVFGKSYQKFVPSWIKSLSSRQLRIFYDALMLGDGTRSKEGKQAYYTSSKKMADDVQEILLKLGFTGSVATVDRRGRVNAKGTTRYIEYRVNIKEKYKTERLASRSLVDYDDFVYCVTVPNHIIFVRRNGKPAWCGNSPENNWSPSDMHAFDAVFHSTTIPVFVAAGDNGSGDGESGQHVDFPGSSPHVICCGGTTLIANVSSSGIQSETVWNDGSQGGATGGGFSTVFARPSCQAHIGFTSNKQRGVPDIAGNADPNTGYNCYIAGQWLPIGGTSACAPLFAGLYCLLKEGSSHPASFFLGFLYEYSKAVRDITEGNNGAYKAAKGWDACTGLGVPVGELLQLDFTVATQP